jgi:voltage-gated potassium channel
MTRTFGTIRGGLRTLLGSLILLLVLYPVLDEEPVGRAIFALLSTAVVLSGAYVASRDRHRFAMALLLAIPAFVARWLFVFLRTPVTRGAALATSIVFFVYTLLLILDHVLRTDEVSGDEVFGAVCVYILIGFVWGMAFGMLDLFSPGSIRNVNGAMQTGDFFYFSFITLMTIGYGDMYPVSPVARSMAIVESMVGIIFVAVLISRLVGLNAGRSRPK